MNIIIVDDERPALSTLERAVKSVIPKENIYCFSSAQEALKYSQENTVDVAFLDIEMCEMNGLILAKKLKDINGDTNIIFATGHSNFALNAFNMHASGYVVKPINPERIIIELENLRKPIKQIDDGIRIQCFGNFEIFIDGKPVTFGRSKAKEALAYLIDRKGAGVSKKELASILMGDKQYSRSLQSYIHTIITEMLYSLKGIDAEHIIIKKRNLYAIDVSKVSCDYYNYEKGIVEAVNSYHGEYMANYSWAEFTTGKISSKMLNELR